MMNSTDTSPIDTFGMGAAEMLKATNEDTILEDYGFGERANASFVITTIGSSVFGLSEKIEHGDSEQSKVSTQFDVEEMSDEVALLPTLQPRGSRGGRFRALQEWEGTVTRVEHDCFSVSLINLSESGTEQEEQAEIPIDDVRPHDLSLLRVGAIVRLAVGYAKDGSGTERKAVSVYFRRILPIERKSSFSALKLDDALNLSSS
jgi:hypothetical protein